MRVSWKHYLKTAGVVQVGGRGTGALTVVLPWDTKTTGTCGNLGGNMCCALGPGILGGGRGGSAGSGKLGGRPPGLMVKKGGIGREGRALCEDRPTPGGPGGGGGRADLSLWRYVMWASRSRWDR